MKQEDSRNSKVRNALGKYFPKERELNITEIKSLLLEQGLRYSLDYTEGNLAGCLRMLVNSEVLVKVRRGVYRRNIIGEDGKDSSSEKKTENYATEKILKDFLKKMVEIRSSVTALGDSVAYMILNEDISREEFDQLGIIIEFRKDIMGVLQKYDA